MCHSQYNTVRAEPDSILTNKVCQAPSAPVTATSSGVNYDPGNNLHEPRKDKCALRDGKSGTSNKPQHAELVFALPGIDVA